MLFGGSCAFTWSILNDITAERQCSNCKKARVATYPRGFLEVTRCIIRTVQSISNSLQHQRWCKMLPFHINCHIACLLSGDSSAEPAPKAPCFFIPSVTCLQVPRSQFNDRWEWFLLRRRRADEPMIRHHPSRGPVVIRAMLLGLVTSSSYGDGSIWNVAI